MCDEIVSTKSPGCSFTAPCLWRPEGCWRVWKLAHGLVRARPEAGAFTVLDANELDRMTGRAPDLSQARYFSPAGIVIDRDLDLVIRKAVAGRRAILGEIACSGWEKATAAGDDHPCMGL